VSGLAFSTLAIFCILIPGFLYQFIFYRVTSGGAASGKIELGAAKPIVIAVLVSLPLHAVWVGSITLIDRYIVPIGTVNFYELIPLMQGEPL
jgi:hypothetical protein